MRFEPMRGNSWIVGKQEVIRGAPSGLVMTSRLLFSDWLVTAGAFLRLAFQSGHARENAIKGAAGHVYS